MAKKHAQLTKGEIATMRKILRLGGKVMVTRGRAGANTVHTSVVERLAARGLIRAWVGVLQGKRVRWTSAHEITDIMVTAEGCQALAQAEA